MSGNASGVYKMWRNPGTGLGIGYWSSLATALGSGSSGGTALTTSMIEFRVLTFLCLKISLKQLELGRLPVRLFRNVNPAKGGFARD